MPYPGIGSALVAAAGSCAAVALLQEEGLQQRVAEPLRRPTRAVPRPARLGLCTSRVDRLFVCRRRPWKDKRELQ